MEDQKLNLINNNPNKNLEAEIKNLMVNKDKNSDFIEARTNNQIISSCAIRRILDSGNYYIYTFEIISDSQKEELKRIQDEWI